MLIDCVPLISRPDVLTNKSFSFWVIDLFKNTLINCSNLSIYISLCWSSGLEYSLTFFENSLHFFLPAFTHQLLTIFSTSSECILLCKKQKLPLPTLACQHWNSRQVRYWTTSILSCLKYRVSPGWISLPITFVKSEYEIFPSPS